MTDNEIHGFIILGGLVAIVYLLASCVHSRQQRRYWERQAKRAKEQRERVIKGLWAKRKY